MLSRRTVLRALAGLGAAGVGLPTYAFGVEPGLRLAVTRYEIEPPGWPRTLDLTIAVIADIHAGAPHMSATRVAEIASATNALEADIVVGLGDYVAGHRWVTRTVPVAECARALSGLRAPLGVYSIIGNHDWWDDRSAQRAGHGPTLTARALSDVGIRVLENDAIRLNKSGEPFWICGLGDMLALLRGRAGIEGVHDLPGTLAKVTDEAPVILLCHEPDIFPEVPGRVALTLSGHTHGGQVRLFGYSPVVPSRFRNRYAYGHVVERDRHLVVSGGLGTSIMPVRFGVPPEIVLVRLRAGAARLG